MKMNIQDFFYLSLTTGYMKSFSLVPCLKTGQSLKCNVSYPKAWEHASMHAGDQNGRKRQRVNFK